MSLWGDLIPFPRRCFVSRVPENVSPLMFGDDVVDFSEIFSGT